MLAREAGVGKSDVWRVLLAGTMLAIFLHPVNGAPCPAGLIIRQAAPGDLVCVARDSKRRAATDNARAPLLWVPHILSQIGRAHV